MQCASLLWVCSVFNILSNIFTYYNDNSKSCTSAMPRGECIGSHWIVFGHDHQTMQSRYIRVSRNDINPNQSVLYSGKEGKPSILAPKRKESIRHCRIARIQGHWWIRDSSMAFGIAGDTKGGRQKMFKTTTSAQSIIRIHRVALVCPQNPMVSNLRLFAMPSYASTKKLANNQGVMSHISCQRQDAIMPFMALHRWPSKIIKAHENLWEWLKWVRDGEVNNCWESWYIIVSNCSAAILSYVSLIESLTCIRSYS